MVPKSAGTIAEILKQNGYNTAQFGKWHLTPYAEMGPAGPFDHWPVGMGFEHFYGFLGGRDQPVAAGAWSRTTPIEPPQDDPTYILDRDLADHAIAWIRTQKACAPEQALLHLLRARHRQRRTMPQGLDRQVQRQVRPGLGQGARGDASPARRSSGIIPADTN